MNPPVGVSRDQWRPSNGRPFRTIDVSPRTLTFTLEDGREVMVTILTHGEVTVAERERADHWLAWGPRLEPTSDTAVPRRG